MNESQSSSSRLQIWQSWRGLGAWNYYFLIKFVLLAKGYLNFDALSNLVFAAILLFPLRSMHLHRIRQWVALPFGFALLYHDTWLPGWRSIINKSEDVAGFSMNYLLELAERFINWQWIAMGFVLLVGYLFVSQWVRLTTFTVLALLWVNLSGMVMPIFAPSPATTVAQDTTTAPAETQNQTAEGKSVNGPPTNANLNAYLEQFYQNESRKATVFPQTLPADAQPFDLLVINICSLSSSDLDAANLSQSPLWSRFDFMFSNFNSAAAYSGPASIRLLRASCGQTSHYSLYQAASQQCYLFDELARLGFTSQLAMDHTGAFGNYIGDLRKYANMQAPLMSQSGLGFELTSFEDTPIFNDGQLFSRWLTNQEKAGTTRSATFFNLIALHDGNRYIGSNKPANYHDRAQTLLNQLNAFMDQLDKSGRKVMLVVVPEHGAALAGDKMQISGLRDIPSPGITHIPVGVKFFGMQAQHNPTPMKIDAPSSYLAISEMVSRAVDGKVFTTQTMDWKTFAANLPQTPLVSENENSVVMEYQGKIYIRLNGGGWVPYPS